MGNEFIMKPKVDFCFRELMADAKVRQGFIGALLGVDPEEVRETRLLPTIPRKGSREDKLEIHVLELPKLAKYEQPETELLKWAKFFQAEKKEEFEMASKDNEYLEKAYERLVNISADEKKRREYEARKALKIPEEEASGIHDPSQSN